MTVRQVIGKRRSVTAMQSRGIKRRAALVDAAIALLEENSPQEISLKQIAAKAEVPEGSAYHFYATKYDLFIDVATQMTQQFEVAFSKPIEGEVNSWHDVIDFFIDGAVEVYRNSRVTRELLIGSKTPPEIKLADDELARQIADTMVAKLNDHFRLPELDDMTRVMYYMVEMADVMLAISVREHDNIQDDHVEEAKRVARGYLATYLPSVLPRA